MFPQSKVQRPPLEHLEQAEVLIFRTCGPPLEHLRGSVSGVVIFRDFRLRGARFGPGKAHKQFEVKPVHPTVAITRFCCCPGCPGVYFSHKSFEVHLVFPHPFPAHSLPSTCFVRPWSTQRSSRSQGWSLMIIASSRLIKKNCNGFISGLTHAQWPLKFGNMLNFRIRPQVSMFKIVPAWHRQKQRHINSWHAPNCTSCHEKSKRHSPRLLEEVVASWNKLLLHQLLLKMEWQINLKVKA